MIRTITTMFLGAAVALTTCAQPSKSGARDADVRAVKELEAQWVKEFKMKDPEKLASHYTDNAVLMGPGMPAAVGIDAICAALKEMVADPNLALTFQAQRVEVARSGDLAYTQGSYNMTMTDPKTKQKANDQGSYVTVYKKQADGSWKAVSDIATSGPPAGGQ